MVLSWSFLISIIWEDVRERVATLLVGGRVILHEGVQFVQNRVVIDKWLLLFRGENEDLALLRLLSLLQIWILHIVTGRDDRFTWMTAVFVKDVLFWLLFRDEVHDLDGVQLAL